MTTATQVLGSVQDTLLQTIHSLLAVLVPQGESANKVAADAGDTLHSRVMEFKNLKMGDCSVDSADHVSSLLDQQRYI